MLVVSSKAQRNRGDRASRIRPKTADDSTDMPEETPHMLILSPPNNHNHRKPPHHHVAGSAAASAAKNTKKIIRGGEARATVFNNF